MSADENPTTLPVAIAALDAAMDELRALRLRVDKLQNFYNDIHDQHK